MIKKMEEEEEESEGEDKCIKDIKHFVSLRFREQKDDYNDQVSLTQEQDVGEDKDDQMMMTCKGIHCHLESKTNHSTERMMMEMMIERHSLHFHLICFFLLKNKWKRH